MNNMTTETMKETTRKVLGTAALFIGSFCVMGCVETPVKAQPSAAPSGLVDLTQAAETSVNAVVYIKVTTNSKTKTVDVQDPFSDFFGDFFGFGGGGRQQRQIQTPKREGSGSGVIISSDGYIVTNNHVVSEADELLVKLNDNREFKGRIIGTDEQTDLALIKIEGKDFPTLPIGNSDDLKLGEWVLAVGNPFNLTSTGTIYSQTGSYTGYGFAIPTTIMNKVVADLKEFGVVQRAQLGVMGNDVTRYIDDEKSKGNDVDLGTVNGVYVAEVQDNSTASEAGLRKGDVVIAVNGKDVKKMAELQEAISTMRPGDKVKITYMRNKKKDTVTAVLRNAQGNTKVLEQMDMDQFGAALKPLDGETKRQLNLPNGLEVVAVKKGKMADAGVEKGWIILQVNDRPMNTMEDFEEAVKEANRSSDRILWIRAVTQSGRLRSAVVELDEK